MAARATAMTPFKGESFPAYIVSRSGGTTRRPSAPTFLELPASHPTVTTLGPSADTVVKRSICSSPTRSQVDTLSLQRISSPPASSAKSALKVSVRQHRPSLTEQLKAISQGAHSITAQLRSSYQLDGSSTRAVQQKSGGFESTWVQAADCLLEATTIHLSVGRLDCRFPCPVQFAADRCSYLFQHPFEAKEIEMIMYYRDMRHTHLSLHERSLRFRVDRSLDQFGEDYRPSNPQHFLKLVFATASEAERVKRFLTKVKSSIGTAEHNE